MLSFTTFGVIFIALVSYYFPQILESPKETPNNKVSPVYDFIIVGAGSAGSVVARRLSEVKAWKILLLEAGGNETAISKTPLLFTTLLNTELDWNYTTTQQARACLTRNGICQYARGHSVGGCSSINAMLYVRGNKEDFNGWADDGAEGWNYNDVLPYFRKSEDVKIPEFYESPYHGRGGFQSVQYSLYATNISNDIIRAGEEVGMINRDYNGELQSSIARSQLTVNGPIRWSTASGFLNGLNRPNLDIVKNAKVTKLVVNSLTKTTAGVVYKKDGKTKFVRARKEVILSAGSINTPQILILAGIGPKDHLDKLSIPMVADLPVGNNLQDHFYIYFPFQLKNYTNLNLSHILTEENSLEFAQNKSGVFTSNGMQNVGFVNVGADITSEPPDVQYHFTELFGSSNIFNTLTTVIKPRSRGTVRLMSKNPEDKPLIDPNYFAEQDDLDKAVAGLKIAMKLMNTTAMEKYSPQISMPDVEFCKDNRSDITDFLTCIAKAYTSTIYHPIGTCRMGSPKAPTSVVDPELRVLGIKNLRVVDASVMPSITRGNTNAATIMIAEKASDIIKSNYRISIN